MELTENNIEFISGQRTATVTLSNRSHITKVRKLHEKYPDEFSYFIENEDGSICCKVPLKWIAIRHPKTVTREYTDEERAAIAERLASYRNK